MGLLRAYGHDVYVAAVGAVATAPCRLGHSCTERMPHSREQNKESGSRRMHLLIRQFGHHMNLGEVSETTSWIMDKPYDLIILPGDFLLRTNMEELCLDLNFKTSTQAMYLMAPWGQGNEQHRFSGRLSRLCCLQSP